MGVTPRYAIVRKNEDGSWAYLCGADGLILAMNEHHARTVVEYLRLVCPSHTYATEPMPDQESCHIVRESNGLSVFAFATWRRL